MAGAGGEVSTPSARMLQKFQGSRGSGRAPLAQRTLGLGLLDGRASLEVSGERGGVPGLEQGVQSWRARGPSLRS